VTLAHAQELQFAWIFHRCRSEHAALEVAKGDCELRGKPTRHDLGEGAAEPILVLVDPAAPFHDLRTYFRTVRAFTS
jgi:hypothetical protein